MPPRVIFFDLDDTLIHEEAGDRVVAEEVVAAALPGHAFPPGAIFAALHQAARELWQRGPQFSYTWLIQTSSIEGLYGDYSGDDPRLAALQQFIQETGYREQVWRNALRTLGIDDPSIASALAVAYARVRADRHIPFPEALPALRRLATRTRLALITNGAPTIQRRKLEGSGLAPFFSPVIISGEVGPGKPDRRIYEHALAQAGVGSSAAWMVGNSLLNDIAGAQAVGLRAIWVNRTGENPPPTIRPDATIRTLDELEV